MQREDSSSTFLLKAVKSYPAFMKLRCNRRDHQNLVWSIQDKNKYSLKLLSLETKEKSLDEATNEKAVDTVGGVKFQNMLMLDNDDDVKDEDIDLVNIIVSKKGNSNWDRIKMKLK